MNKNELKAMWITQRQKDPTISIAQFLRNNNIPHVKSRCSDLGVMGDINDANSLAELITKRRRRFKTKK